MRYVLCSALLIIALIVVYREGYLFGYRQAQQDDATIISLQFVPPEINRAYLHKYPNPRLKDKSNG